MLLHLWTFLQDGRMFMALHLHKFPNRQDGHLRDINRRYTTAFLPRGSLTPLSTLKTLDMSHGWRNRKNPGDKQTKKPEDGGVLNGAWLRKADDQTNCAMT
jgi:hypothetical protein